jgi:catechol 2,3-dioxygenase-like lactoylglutathione lyase family enzyme
MRFGRAIAVFVALAQLAATPARAQDPSPLASSAPATAVVSVCITVSDLERSMAFYSAALDCTLVSQQERAGDASDHLLGVFGARVRIATLALGDERLELSQFLTPGGRAIPTDSRSNDLWFQHAAIAVADIDAAYARLREWNVRHASSDPQTLPNWNPGAAGISAFYFKDPDGHTLEIIHFPQGKGDPRWHSATDRLFLGIDHTAIVVSDTDRSLAFYRDALGLRVTGASENYGPEQERLNGVFCARLRITTLRAPRGPGIELLEYLAPSDGREYPRDARTFDLLHWHTTITVPDADRASVALRATGARWVSPGAVPSPCAETGALASMLRDPDGHALLLVTDNPTDKESTP